MPSFSLMLMRSRLLFRVDEPAVFVDFAFVALFRDFVERLAAGITAEERTADPADENEADQEQRRDFVFESAMILEHSSSNWTSTLTLNRGTNCGIAVKDCVVSAEGYLVGVVSEVGYNWATVLTVIDTDTELGALVFRTSAVAVAEGDFALMNEGRLKLSYLPESASLLSGDYIVTSGLGGYYPSNLVIGTVESVKVDDDGLAQYAVIAPMVDFDTLTEIFVIKDFTVID